MRVCLQYLLKILATGKCESHKTPLSLAELSSAFEIR